MNGRQQRPFAYGTFRWPGKGGSTSRGLPPPPSLRPGEPDIALEILREFGATELIGKIHVRQLGGAWIPAQWDLLRSSVAYQNYFRRRQHFFFDMVGSGLWEVLHFRAESEETGPYVAVALRYHSKTYPWVALQREQERSL